MATDTKEEIYRVSKELQDRTHSQQTVVPSYLKADWLLYAFAMYMLHSMQT